jgi:peptidoglycan-associated lipoprotein
MMTVYRKTAASAVLCLVLGLGIAACGKNQQVAQTPPPPTPPTTPAAPPAPPPPPAPAPAAPPRALTEDELFAQKSVDQLNKERPLSDVFFELDSSSIRDDARGALTANANWLKRWPARINIEGHCDERGTAEYNLALGERRANAVKAYLVELGVPADRIAVVSKGKESPFCTESNESCWQQNRRGHFVITATK